MSEMPSSSLLPVAASSAPAWLDRCPVCHQRQSSHLCSKDGYHIHTCQECGCDYVRNPPGDEALKAYYSRQQWFEAGEVGGYVNYDEQSRESLPAIDVLLARFHGRVGSILDLGCGYGNHLRLAAELGWRCFGVEISEHARSIAQERLGGSALIVAAVEELIPHSFDVILILDVLEHLSDPYHFLYPLFALGAIQPHTLLVVTTPNAGSIEARVDPAGWSYRHPPSHLTYFSRKSLQVLFHALRFSEIRIEGRHPIDSGPTSRPDLENFAGLWLEASGSDFQAFMQERYVPSTWSELAEYEHLPRYALACRFAHARRVLDFGCGTGYGTAMLAHAAAWALGVDNAPSALEWAQRCHRLPNLSFQRDESFLDGFDDDSVDLITCFEMIEHVSEPEQERTVQAFARVLCADGLLLISTPNPEMTSLYGDNPHHLAERTREQFLALLQNEFPFVHLVDQYALAVVCFLSSASPSSLQTLLDHPLTQARSLAYLALCSHRPLPPLPDHGFLDTERDYIRERLFWQRSLMQARLQAYHSQQVVATLQGELAEARQQLEAHRHRSRVVSTAASVLKRALAPDRWTRFGQQLRGRGLPGILLVQVAHAQGRRLLGRRSSSIPAGRAVSADCLAPAVLEATPSAYTVRQPLHQRADRPMVLHAIANFCLGGSSRLVVDLIESLGESFEQVVVTRHIPRPAAFLNLTIHECCRPGDTTPFEALINHYKPAFVHVHYWGDCDRDWYDLVFRACERMGIAVIQNVNTPVSPHPSAAIRRTVYVSAYVHRVFGRGDHQAIVIHPGSDLDHFSVPEASIATDDCIGMVYRLETDKLNQRSLDALINVARRRPATRCLIVGEGSLKSVFEKRVSRAGLAANFDFVGSVPYQDLPAYYRQMSLFVAPVWQESFGQVSCFAMGMSLPVVGYAVGALPSIVDDERLLVPYGDHQGLADRIMMLLDDREQRHAIGLANRQRARARFSVAQMVASYADLYASMPSLTLL